MVQLRRNEDRPTPKQVYNWRVWSLAATASFASMMIGYDSAFIGGTIALPSFIDSFGVLSSDTKANIVSAYQAGAILGAILGYPIARVWGRKWGLFFSAAIFTVASIIMTITTASTGLAPIYVGRVIAGVAIGIASNLTPIFISEISPPSIRGQLVGIYELGWQIGGIIGFWIPYGVNTTLAPTQKQWVIPFGVQLIPGGLFMIGSAFFLVESPRWLLSRNREAEAIKNLCFIRQLDAEEPYIVDELASMREQLDHERSIVGDSWTGPFKVTFGVKKVLYRLFLGSALFAFQSATGIQAINYYSPTVFKSIGLGTNSSLLSSGVFGVIKTLGAIFWILFLIDRFGRRKIFMWGALGGAVAMYGIAAYIAIDKPTQGGSGGSATGAALFLFYLWTAFYAPSWNGTPWVFGSEVFSTACRPLAQASMSASNWIWTFVLARATPYMFDTMDYGVYLFFATMMMISIPFVFFLIPETKGVPLEDMDELFERKPVWRAGPSLMEDLRNRERPSDNLSSTMAVREVASLPNGGSSGTQTPPEKDLDSKNELELATKDHRQSQ